jgi:RHS repeat-associated protein
MGTGGTYTYDGSGLRVKKVASGTTTVYIFSGSQVIAEYDNGALVGSPSREYIYSRGQRIAAIQGGATTYLHTDHLSVRVSTDSTGNNVRSFSHYPYGETWYETGTADKLKFTTYERDSESTNDYAMARYFINRFGRFLTTDPLSGDISNPQSLNRYAYVIDDPTDLSDPSGECYLNGFAGPNCNSDPQYAGFATQCTIDGVSAPCSMAFSQLRNGTATQCARGDCPNFRTGQNGQFQYYQTKSYSDPDCPPPLICGGIEGHWVDISVVFMGQGSGNSSDSWLGTAVKTFFTVPYRKPGETFTACWNRAASDTLVGMGVPREATPGTEALLGSAGTVGLFSSVKSIWALGNWVRPSSYLAKAMGAGSAGVRAARISGQAMAASLAAEAGLRAGAALDCAIPVN